MNTRHRFIAVALASSSLLAACGGRTTPALSQLSQRTIQSAAIRTGPQLESPGVHAYYLGDGSANTAFMMDLRVGPDGKAYYATIPQFSGNSYPDNGEIGSFDLSTHEQVYEPVSYAPGFIQDTQDGSVFVTEMNNASGNPTIDRYAGIGGADMQIPIPKPQNWWTGGFGNGISGGIALDTQGNVWFGSDLSGQVGEIDPSTDVATMFGLNSPNEPWEPVPQYMILGTDGRLWVTDFFNDGVFRFSVQGKNIGQNSFFPMPQGPYSQTNYVSLQGIVEGPGKTLFTGNVGTPGTMDTGGISLNPTFASIPLPTTNLMPYVFAAAKGKIYFNDVRFSGLGIYNTATKHTTILPLVPKAFGGIVVDARGVPWIGCETQRTVGCIARVNLTSEWHVYPLTTLKLYSSDSSGNPFPPGLIGIGETGNSGPFTVSSSNTAVCTAAVISGFDHNILVTPSAVGSCALSITDAHSRTVTVKVNIVNGSGQPQAQVRPSRLPRPRFN